ncbi:MAG: sugar ABC transporter permease [Chloroflexi bacterium]|nr:sugar ABC transporter permease [Chloroflexota bacterium]
MTTPPSGRRDAAVLRLDRGIALLFLVPALVAYSGFVVWPTIQLVIYSGQEWNGVLPPEPAGLDNFVRLTTDTVFHRALTHNVLWMTAALVVPVGIGLLLALLVTRAPIHGRSFFRLVLFLPQVLNPVAVAILWGWMYDPASGAINRLLGSVGLGGLAHPWLGDPATTLPALFVAWSWLHYGFVMIILIAAIEGIDEQYFDMARIDGAGRVAQLRVVVLPFIRGPLGVVALITAIASFQVFDLVYLLTGGGPARSSIVLPLHMLDHAFTFRNVGYASAIAVVMTAGVLLLSVVFLRGRGPSDAR